MKTTESERLPTLIAFQLQRAGPRPLEICRVYELPIPGAPGHEQELAAAISHFMAEVKKPTLILGLVVIPTHTGRARGRVTAKIERLYREGIIPRDEAAELNAQALRMRDAITLIKESPTDDRPEELELDELRRPGDGERADPGRPDCGAADAGDGDAPGE